MSLKIFLKYQGTQHPVASVYAHTVASVHGHHLALADGYVTNITNKTFVNA